MSSGGKNSASMLSFTLGYLTSSIGKSVFNFLSSLWSALPPTLYWLMQIDVLLRNRDYQGESEFSGFCGSQEEHTLIRTHLSSFYLCGGIKLMGIILNVFRCFFLSIFVL